MDQLEKKKKELIEQGHEAVSDDNISKIHIEEKAVQLFLWADTEDRAANFNKNVVKSFYTASLLYDVLAQFGELSEEALHHCKYAKWKAAYIHKCLKSGETPIPGPAGGDDENLGGEAEGGMAPYPPLGPTDTQQPPYPTNTQQPPYPTTTSGIPGQFPSQPYPPDHTHFPTPPALPSAHPSAQPSAQPSPTVAPVHPVVPPTIPSSATPPTSSLSPEDNEKAQKYCRFAASALQYEDVQTAVENLHKALALLQK